jgi:hypothetical protein
MTQIELLVTIIGGILIANSIERIYKILFK